MDVKILIVTDIVRGKTLTDKLNKQDKRNNLKSNSNPKLEKFNWKMHYSLLKTSHLIIKNVKAAA